MLTGVQLLTAIGYQELAICHGKKHCWGMSSESPENQEASFKGKDTCTEPREKVTVAGTKPETGHTSQRLAGEGCMWERVTRSG